MTMQFFFTVVRSCVTIVLSHLQCWSTHFIVFITRLYIVCVCTQGGDDDYQFGSIYAFNKRKERQLLVFFLSFLFYSILPPNTQTHALRLSSIRCENKKNNCIFLVVQYLPINCSQINYPDARQLNATVTDGFDKHTRGTFEQCLMACKIEQEKRTRRIAIKRSQNECDLW